MGIDLGRKDVGAGGMWGKGEKGGTTVSASTIKIKIKKLYSCINWCYNIADIAND